MSGNEGVSLTESIFHKLVKLIRHLQHAAFATDAGHAWRESLIDTVVGQIAALKPKLIGVKMKLQHVERYKHRGAFQVLTEADVMTMNQELTPIVFMDERDEHAKRFDNLIAE